MTALTEALAEVADAVSAHHDQKTLLWRFEELHRMGFSKDDALTLADSRSDLKTIWRSLRVGCTHEFAVRIWG